MDFPTWVTEPKTKKGKSAARLLYAMRYLAVRADARGSMRALAEKIGVNHSTLVLGIRAGKFKVPTAYKIVQALGDEDITLEFLLDPMTADNT